MSATASVSPRSRGRAWLALAGWLVLAALLALVGLEIGERRPEYVPAREIVAVWGDGAWRVAWLHPASFSYDAGLRVGDVVLATDGRPVLRIDSPATWLDQPSILTVARGGSELQIVLPQMDVLGLAGRLAYLVAGILFGLVGVFTWIRSAGGRVQAHFLLLCAAAGLLLATVPASQRGQPLGVVFLYVFAQAALTALYIFLRYFPQVRPFTIFHGRIAAEWLWLGPLAAYGAYGLALGGYLPYEPLRLATYVWNVIMLASSAAAVVQSWRLARAREDRRARAQLKIIGGGALLGFLPLLLVIVPQALAGRYVVRPEMVVPLTALLPVSVAYAMLRYRVMDVDLVVRRGAAYAITAVIYLGALAAVHGLTNGLSLPDLPLLGDALQVLAGLLLIPVFLVMVRHLDRVVYGRGYDPEATLAETGRALATTLDEQRLLAIALERVQATLQPALVILYERDESGRFQPLAWRYRHDPRAGEAVPSLPADHRALPIILAGRGWQAGGTLLRGDDHPAEETPIYPTLLVPAVNDPAGVTCLLGLMPRPSGLPYSREDMAWLAAMVQSLAAALANARHYGRLQAAYADLRETQLQLIQAAKLGAVGEVASGIAHELNQPLTVIRGRIQQLITQVEPDVARRLARIEEQTFKMARIIDHMRSFIRQTQDARQPVDINLVVDQALLLLEEQLRGRNIDLIVERGEGLPTVLGDAAQLEQVLINLLSNARDAVAGQPQPQIRIATRVAGEGQLTVLSVTDSGVGIAPSVQEQIFEPFFTTKPDGQGTGLGLSISRSIVERHGGRIEVESQQPGQQTCFRVLLPALAASNGATKAVPCTEPAA